ncbi:MAG TPA: hypothetical protein VKU44_04365, partial [Terriglobia bacterium]|nr:hypothetical protein [Terriglobia bacterium]
GLDLTGRLRVEGQSQLRFNTGSGEVNLSGIQVSLQPRDQMPFGVQPATLSPDGSFALKNVPSGTYQVVVCCLPGDLYLKAAHLGGDDGLEQGINVDQGNPPSDGLDLVVSTAGGHINGQVTSDQKPAAAATVVLVPDANRRDQTRFYSATPTDAQGAFSMSGITPGDYTLFAWRKVEDGAYFDPDFIRSYEGRGKAVRVDEGGKLQVELELIAADDAK